MKKTTKDIIKILAFETEFKKELLEKFDSLTDDQQLNITNIVWGGYDAIYQLKFQENLETALYEARNNREKINDGLYDRVRELTDSQMMQVSAEDIKEMDLDLTREKLAEMISQNKPS